MLLFFFFFFISHRGEEYAVCLNKGDARFPANQEAKWSDFVTIVPVHTGSGFKGKQTVELAGA